MFLVEPFAVQPSEKIIIVSKSFRGFSLALVKPLGLVFLHCQSYLKSGKLLTLTKEQNGSWPNNTIAPFGLMMRFNCSHIGSSGMMESHLHAVVPYGGSVSTISTLPLGISFILSRQSPCINQ